MKPENKFIDFNLSVKSEDVKDTGLFTGYASTFGGDPDSYGDIIAPGAFARTLHAGGYGGNGIKMLWQHDTHEPIGVWNVLREDSAGLYVEGQLALLTELGKRAYELLKLGALNTMSIGFRIKSYEYDEDKDIRTLTEIELYEISLVTFPANTNATITAVKTAVEDIRQAEGSERELEMLLREATGFSKSAAKYLVSLCKQGLKQREAAGSEVEILEVLKQTNALLSGKEM